MNRPVSDRTERAMGDVLAFVIFAPLVLLIVVAVITPMMIRAAIEPHVDRAVQSYVSTYAAYGTLVPPKYSPNYITGANTSLDVRLRAYLVNRNLMRDNSNLVVECGPVGVDGLIRVGEDVEAGSMVGCRVAGDMKGWPTVGPLMSAAPAVFGMEYLDVSLAYSDRGSNDAIQ